MDPRELLEAAHELSDFYKSSLLLDPFIKISIDILDGDFVSKLERDNFPLAWRIMLNPKRHADITDVQYSVVEGILNIMFGDLLLIAPGPVVEEFKNRIVSRLTSAISQMSASTEELNEELDEG